MQRQGRRVLLMVNNFSAYHVQASLRAVTLLLLPPDATSKVQLLDLGIMRVFRASYRTTKSFCSASNARQHCHDYTAWNVDSMDQKVYEFKEAESSII